MPENELNKKLQEAREECERLRLENAELRAMIGMKAKEAPAAGYGPEKRVEATASPKPAIDRDSPSEAKVKVFRSLFRGRDDVYPVRWESRAGRTGYSPACAHEWDRVYCAKPKIKCGQCDHRELLPLTNRVIYDHLAGKHTIGLYTLLQDETCLLLAVDFDKAAWREDAAAFMETCNALGVPAVLERSRSGNGGHVWIFFEGPVQASLARKLGCAVLCYTMNKRPELGLDSYDRLFPSQDTMPRGGFGSLIALPLQREPRENGNSVFLDRDFRPYEDQWQFLASVRKMNRHDADALVSEAARTGNIIGVRMSVCEEDRDDDPWVSVPARKRKRTIMQDPMPQSVRVVIGNMVFVEKDGLPPSAINGITRLAAFQNPEFYRMQAMRMSTFNKPRVISCAEDFHRHIAVPRGCLEDLLCFLKESGTAPAITDERFAGRPIRASFKGTLRPEQQEALKRIMEHDIGVMSAATAFGKTVVAAGIIAERKVNTLVLVHRMQLMDQWKARLEQFLDLPQEAAPGQSEEEPEAGDAGADADAATAGKKKKGRKKRAKKIEPIGVIGGGKDRRTGKIDVGIIQSIVKKGRVKDLITEYGQVIVDECHHISAISFEQVIKKAKARFVLGLTATPTRKDGHHPIIMMQCGPIRFRTSTRAQALERPFEYVVIPRFTDFSLPVELQVTATTSATAIQDIYTALTLNEQRNMMIFNDLLLTLEQGRSPLLITERTEHLEYFAGMLKGFAKNIIILKGGMGVKKRREVAERIASIPDSEERLLLGTGRYIGEGFDDARLDTLLLALPISWRGTLKQYAGRLHRLHESKKVVKIYDYVDVNIPVLMKMYARRLKGYRSIGYALAGDDELTLNRKKENMQPPNKRF